MVFIISLTLLFKLLYQPNYFSPGYEDRPNTQQKKRKRKFDDEEQLAVPSPSSDGDGDVLIEESKMSELGDAVSN